MRYNVMSGAGRGVCSLLPLRDLRQRGRGRDRSTCMGNLLGNLLGWLRLGWLEVAYITVA